MKIFDDFDQYSDEYWKAKRGLASSSNFEKIMTPATLAMAAQAKGYAMEIVAEKYDLGYAVYDGFATSAMKNASILEPQDRSYYEMERDMDVKQVGGCLSDCGRFWASTDGLVGDDGVLEIKHPLAKTQVEYLIDGCLPKKYVPQVHGELIVTGRKWVDFLSYSPGLPHLLVRVVPNETTEILRERLEQFWKLYIPIAARIAECDATAKRPTVEAYY